MTQKKKGVLIHFRGKMDSIIGDRLKSEFLCKLEKNINLELSKLSENDLKERKKINLDKFLNYEI